jgi:osmotically-inducible protein OsmY
MNDDAVDASDINVDTNSQTKVVTLKGFVRSAEHRARAEAIAKREATGYRVNNQLTVRGSR